MCGGQPSGGAERVQQTLNLVVGPGRVALVGPAVIVENRPMVICTLTGTQVWRCAPEQLRRARNREVTIAELLEGQKFNVPVADLLKKVTNRTSLAWY